MRLKIDINKLDKELAGGIPESTAILVKGPPGAGKTIFCNQFIYSGIKNKESALYITFYAPPEEIKEKMKKLFGTFDEKLIIFVDVYSWKTGCISRNKYIVEQPSDLNELNIKITEAIMENKNKNIKRATIDSLSTLLLYVPADLALRFINVLISKLKANGITTTVILEEGMHPETVENSLEAMTDGCIELTIDKTRKKRLLRIARMPLTKHSLNWYEFDITDKGIKFK